MEKVVIISTGGAISASKNPRGLIGRVTKLIQNIKSGPRIEGMDECFCRAK